VIDPQTLHAFLLQDPPAPGPAAPATSTAGTQGQTGAPSAPPAWTSFLPLVIIFVLFYMLLIRPQRKQQKEREAMIGNLKKNDHVVTTGGIRAVVDRIKDNDIYLRVDEKSDVRLRVVRSAIAAVEKVSGADEGQAETDKNGRK
jgi:preprotein translocase subunit YajC